MESIKIKKYADIDQSKYIVVPFVVELTGALGESAKTFAMQLHERRNIFATRKRRLRRSSTNLLLSRISIELAKSNAQMISTRRPPPVKLYTEKIVQIDMRLGKLRSKARANLARQPASLRNPNPVQIAHDPPPRPPDPKPPAKSEPAPETNNSPTKITWLQQPQKTISQSIELANYAPVQQQAKSAATSMALDVDDQVDDEMNKEPPPSLHASAHKHDDILNTTDDLKT